MLEIVNKSKRQLPDYFEDDIREICQRAHIAPSSIRVIIKRSNLPSYYSCLGKLQRSFYDHRGPSGTYNLDFRTIIIRLSKGPKRNDTRYVLAHEIGHLKAHREARPIETLRRLTITDYGEAKANNFALSVCHCYPASKYPGIKKFNSK